MDEVRTAIQEAGKEAKQFTKDWGWHITKISLIPFYGWVLYSQFDT
jgi:hypothetical protein